MTRSKRRGRRGLEAPEPLEEVISRAGEDRFAKKRPPIPLPEWRAAVGARIADRAKPIAIDGGVLVVRVATSVWATELQMLAPELIMRLKQRGFAVERMRFRVGQLEPVDRPPERRVARKVPPPAPLPSDLSRVVSGVADDGLREAIEEAARANLAWQEYVSAAPQGARGPRDAGTGTAPRGRTAAGSGATSPRNRGGDSGRRR